MSNMTARIVSGAVMVPVVLAAVIWLPPWLWAVAVGLVAAGAAREIARLAIASGVAVSASFIAAAAFALAWVVAAAPSSPVPLTGSDAQVGVAIVLVVGAFLEQLRRRPEMRSAAAWGLTVAVPVYVGGMASFAIRLRALDIGVAWVLCMLVLVWINDSAAYFGGRAFGRHPMAPALSPKKTWEGLVVGTVVTIAVACLGFVAVHNVVASHMFALGGSEAATIGMSGEALAKWIGIVALLGALVSIAGPIGDLSHSFIKRQFGAKDSSNLIPGHGGIWDRIDSLLFVAPLVYVFARLLGA